MKEEKDDRLLDETSKEQRLNQNITQVVGAVQEYNSIQHASVIL
jgi:hypothetical protein